MLSSSPANLQTVTVTPTPSTMDSIMMPSCAPLAMESIVPAACPPVNHDQEIWKKGSMPIKAQPRLTLLPWPASPSGCL